MPRLIVKSEVHKPGQYITTYVSDNGLNENHLQLVLTTTYTSQPIVEAFITKYPFYEFKWGEIKPMHYTWDDSNTKIEMGTLELILKANKNDCYLFEDGKWYIINTRRKYEMLYLELPAVIEYLEVLGYEVVKPAHVDYIYSKHKLRPGDIIISQSVIRLDAINHDKSLNYYQCDATWLFRSTTFNNTKFFKFIPPGSEEERQNYEFHNGLLTFAAILREVR